MPTFTCSNAGFSVSNGTIGDPVVASVSAGTLVSVSPSTYQSGSATYTGTITVPSGYTNTGSNITCTDTATGGVSCYAHQVLYSSSTACGGSQMTVYTDNSNFCSSSKIYNASSACTSGGTQYASSGYYTYPAFNSGGNQEYSYWNGTSFTQTCVPGCP